MKPNQKLERVEYEVIIRVTFESITESITKEYRYLIEKNETEPSSSDETDWYLSFPLLEWNGISGMIPRNTFFMQFKKRKNNCFWQLFSKSNVEIYKAHRRTTKMSKSDFNKILRNKGYIN